MSSSSSSYSSPCAACKFLRRKCMPGCIFAPYFPPEEPQKFANVHKVFGASNVTKLLNELLPHQREDAVNSLAYEAEARVRDPVYGCVGAISFLQRQVERLQKELDAANADLMRYTCNEITTSAMAASFHHPMRQIELNRRMANQGRGGGGGAGGGAAVGGSGGGGGFYQTQNFPFPCPLPWHNNDDNNNNNNPSGEYGGGEA